MRQEMVARSVAEIGQRADRGGGCARFPTSPELYNAPSKIDVGPAAAWAGKRRASLSGSLLEEYWKLGARSLRSAVTVAVT